MLPLKRNEHNREVISKTTDCRCNQSEGLGRDVAKISQGLDNLSIGGTLPCEERAETDSKDLAFEGTGPINNGLL